MAELERRATGTAPARTPEAHATDIDIERPQTPADIDNLPAMLGRLGDEVMTMVDAKLGLVKLELKEEAAVYARGVAFIAVGGVLAAVGFAFLNVTVAFFISTLFDTFSPPVSYALGFLITGALYLIVGGALVVVMKNRLAAHDPAPARSLEELRKDKQWLKKEI